MGHRAVRPFLYGGVAFTGGALLDGWGHPVLIAHWFGPHEVFHVSVIAGLTLHWMFIRRLLVIGAATVPVASAAPTAPAAQAR
jgi:predicted membrane channel-forming protein YqfA (hemolysin III family)